MGRTIDGGNLVKKKTPHIEKISVNLIVPISLYQPTLIRIHLCVSNMSFVSHVVKLEFNAFALLLMNFAHPKRNYNEKQIYNIFGAPQEKCE